MSYGSRKNNMSEAERGRREVAATVRPSNVVMVKLKPGALRESAAAVTATAGRRGRSLAAATPVGLVGQLLRSGIVSMATPVFPGPVGELVNGARGVAVARRGLRAAASSEGPAKRARGLTSLKVEPGASPAQVARDLMSDPAVEYAYVPAVKHPMAAGPDPLFARQWSHAAVRVHEARKRKGFKEASTVLVAVVDSGVDDHHPDLAKSIAHYVNFLAPAEDDRDYRGHGTHVAGIIAAVINNNVGIAGLCKARIAAIKALPRAGGEWNATAYYRALAHPIELGARVVNLSLGGGEDPGERDVILDLLDAGIVVVAAMGNEFEEGNPTSYPAAYRGVIAVGASDEVDRRASFSCTGKHIALVAPGERILSTVPHYKSELADTTMYDSWPGTSMATPHVAAAAALILAKNPKLKPADVRKKLCSSADKVQWQKKQPDSEYGHGRLNIARALR
jgi:subtilisin family serine protease